MLFFAATPNLTTAAALVGVSVGAASLAAGYVFSSLIVQMLKGAIYGAIGAYALTALGFGTCAMLPAVAVGALVGVAVLVPLSFVAGLSWIFPGNDDSQENNSDDDIEAVTAIAGFSLRIGIIFVSSLLISTAILLGSMPAAAVAAGAAITDLTIEAGKSALGFGS